MLLPYPYEAMCFFLSLLSISNSLFNSVSVPNSMDGQSVCIGHIEEIHIQSADMVSLEWFERIDAYDMQSHSSWLCIVMGYDRCDNRFAVDTFEKYQCYILY